MSKQKYTLTLHQVSTPLREPVTKFGGQPVWITEPQWPLSQMYGTPMRFICQIRLSPELFGPLEAHMAYIFMTDPPEEDWDPYSHGPSPDTFDPAAGENAVILQPGIWTGPTLPLNEGPTLYAYPKEPSEYAVELHAGADAEDLTTPWPDMTEEELSDEEDDLDDEAWMLKHQTHPTAWDLRYEASVENKIGGIPVPTTNYDTFPYCNLSGSFAKLARICFREISWRGYASSSHYSTHHLQEYQAGVIHPFPPSPGTAPHSSDDTRGVRRELAYTRQRITDTR